jgi:hypothetical protein
MIAARCPIRTSGGTPAAFSVAAIVFLLARANRQFLGCDSGRRAQTGPSTSSRTQPFSTPGHPGAFSTSIPTGASTARSARGLLSTIFRLAARRLLGGSAPKKSSGGRSGSAVAQIDLRDTDRGLVSRRPAQGRACSPERSWQSPFHLVASRLRRRPPLPGTTAALRHSRDDGVAPPGARTAAATFTGPLRPRSRWRSSFRRLFCLRPPCRASVCFRIGRARAAAGSALGFAIATLAVLLCRLAQPRGYPTDAWYLRRARGSPPRCGHRERCWRLPSSPAVSPRSASVIAVLLGGFCWAAVPVP